jgi:sodium/proline symporter
VKLPFFGIAWALGNPEAKAVIDANPERVFLVLSRELFNPWIAGVLLMRGREPRPAAAARGGQVH